MDRSASTKPDAELLALFSTEAQLLFTAASGEAPDAAARELMAGDVDWALLCQLAEREGASPIMREYVAQAGVQPSRDPSLVALNRVARVTAFKMDYLHSRIRDTVSALTSRGIECVLLKGAALAPTAYRSVNHRPMIDIDLLVRHRSAQQAMTVLLETGWAWQDGKPRDGDFDVFHHFPALLDARGMEISLEMHTALFPPDSPFALPADEIFAKAQYSVAAKAHIPHPTHLLLHTCIHFAWSHLLRKHAWRAFRDTVAILGTFDIEWDRFIAAAKAARAETCCYWTFRLARNLIGAPIPAHVLAALRPPLPELALRSLERHFAIILFPSGPGCPSIRLRRIMWSAGIAPRWSGHGTSRPWDTLALSPEAAKTKGVRNSALWPTDPRDTWAAYWRNVLLGAKPRPAGQV